MANHPASKAITESLAQILGQSPELSSWLPVSGGDINQAWLTQTSSGESFFVKTNHHDKLPMFEAEASGLTELKRRITEDNPLRVPQSLCTGANEQYTWLVMEYIPFGHSSGQSERELGRGLAMLHQQTAPQFGLNHDNFIGSTPQPNHQHNSWLDFLTHERFVPQFEFAKQHGFFPLIAKEAEGLLDTLPALIDSHQPEPSLIHGDLWGGNKAVDESGTPLIFDPACYYGDRECDLAMTELFGGFSSSFYDGYNETFPIAEGYQERKKLYNLYHILNHANLFGSHYIQQSKSIMQQLIMQAA